ncbi:MAG: hypothetical protein RLZZ592_243 [Pseudomonadota bacterium]|jgi:NTE family protein
MLDLSLLRRRLRPPRPLPLSLALQGGGAHGAYAWGVLDALLESGRFEPRAISGASAGAMNALVLADGWLRGGADGARAALAAFWGRLGELLPTHWFVVGDDHRPSLHGGVRLAMQWSRWLFAPRQLNPLDLNPLRDLLLERVDFHRLRQDDAPRIFIATTRADTGRLRLFDNRRLSVEVALASACLPTLHHTVMIDGLPHWDGGFSANPPLWPLVEHGPVEAELMILMLMPMRFADLPDSAAAIRERSLDIAFGAAFQREAQLLGRAWSDAREGSGWGGGPLARRLRGLRLHLIDEQQTLADLPGESRLIAHRPFLTHLHDLGRERARAWLEQHQEDLGRRSTVDLAEAFG